MGLSAGPRQRLRLEHERAQVVGQPAATLDRVEPGRERVVLGGDTGGVEAGLIVVVVAGRRAYFAVALVVLGGVVA